MCFVFDQKYFFIISDKLNRNKRGETPEGVSNSSSDEDEGIESSDKKVGYKTRVFLPGGGGGRKSGCFKCGEEGHKKANCLKGVAGGRVQKPGHGVLKLQNTLVEANRLNAEATAKLTTLVVYLFTLCFF